MKLNRRFTLVSLAAVNLLVAVLLLFELWGFHHDLDRTGFLRKIDDQHKTAMLRNLHYWGIPPIAFLTIVSGTWFWRLGREEKE